MQESNQSVYKIYSRNRLKIFKPKSKRFNKNFNFLYIVLIFGIAFLVFTSLWRSINPIFENICQDEAKGIATKITNEESAKALQNYNYDDLFIIKKDELRKYTDGK